MAPFGRNEDRGQDKQERLAQWRLAAQAEVERLSSLPLTELAAEVMIKGFAAGAPGASDTIGTGQGYPRAGSTAGVISFEFVPERGFSFPVPAPEEIALREQVAMLVAEGLQQLEHASLVRCQRAPCGGSELDGNPAGTHGAGPGRGAADAPGDRPVRREPQNVDSGAMSASTICSAQDARSSRTSALSSGQPVTGCSWAARAVA
jgi:hypothetical protein